MLIRVKRKRDEDALDSLLVEETEQRINKRSGSGINSLLPAMQNLSTNEEKGDNGATASGGKATPVRFV